MQHRELLHSFNKCFTKVYYSLCIMLPASTFIVSFAEAASLPDHKPLSILIIADEVNPHRLSDEDLTQPKDLEPALSSPLSGLQLSSIQTVDSLCADDAISVMDSESPPDVVLYFAHRAASYCNGEDAQADLTELIEEGLKEGLGFVAFHHGLYVDFINRGAKSNLLQLIGGEADSIEWNTDTGQRVINVGNDHFISNNGITYYQTETISSRSSLKHLTAGSYPAFSNVPDELYEVFRLHVEPGEIRTPLFASNSGEPRLLSYVLQREGWTGRVIVWQPGEYQPNSIDNVDGENFQILVNALYFAVYGGS